jgi:hypothetical protein
VEFRHRSWLDESRKEIDPAALVSLRERTVANVLIDGPGPGLGDIELAQEHFKPVLDMEAPDSLRGMARSGLRKIAVREFNAKGPRMDAVFYLLDAMRLFRGKSLQEIQEITFEIGMLEMYGYGIMSTIPSQATSCV